MKTKSNWITTTKYAELCGVTPATIAYRVKKGIIKARQQEGCKTCPFEINIVKYPPIKGTLKSGRKKSN